MILSLAIASIAQADKPEISLSDWINIVLAVLALAGVLTAIWAVLLSDSRTLDLNTASRLDGVARAGQAMILTSSAIQADILPLWELTEPEFAEIQKLRAGTLNGTTEALSRVISATSDFNKVVQVLHVHIESLQAHQLELRFMVSSLPKKAQNETSEKVIIESQWLRDVAMVLYLSLVAEGCRADFRQPDSRKAVLDHLERQYGTDAPDRDELMARATRRSDASAERNGVTLVTHFLNSAKHDLLESIVKVSTISK
jgi:hypothetical protein